MKKMSGDRVAAIALAVGTVLWVVLAAMRPKMEFQPGEAVDMYVAAMTPTRVIYGGMLAATLLCVFGFAGLAARLGADSSRARLGFTAYVAGAALLAAAMIIRGFVFPDLALRYTGANEPDTRLFLALLSLGLAASDVLARLAVIATAGAMVVWSLALLERRREAFAVGVAGEALALVPLLAFAAGMIHLDLAGFRLVIGAQAAWSLAVAWVLHQGKLEAPA